MSASLDHKKRVLAHQEAQQRLQAATTTNSITPNAAPLSLDELTKMLATAPAPPIGFIVSEEIWRGLMQRRDDNAPHRMAMAAPETFSGVRIVADPKMPATEFEVVNTQEAWRKRLREIKGEQP